MTPFFDKVSRAFGTIARALARLRERTGKAFLSKGENFTHASERSERLKREEMEAERIDRLRNPSDYQGR
jgi:hypothetical protein